jgi:hypothetical protein
MTICETPDFIYPMQADIYYPSVEQGAYGNVKKQWMLDRTIVGNFVVAGSATKEEIKPNVNITQTGILSGRSKTDPRFSSMDESASITNIVITNIRDKFGNQLYKETSGIRVGKSTIFEIATVEPFMSPFGGIDYYNIILRRSENQASDV